MIVITSPHNDKLKEIRRLQRRRERRFVAEGEDLLQAAADAGWPAVYEQHWAKAPTGPVCIALWGVHDPGNVGTVLRSALAFGAASVAIGPDTADPFGPKAVRASMGAIFEVPVARVASVAQLPQPRIALVARGGEPLRGPKEGTLVLGAERQGLPSDVVEACDAAASIAIAGDSLNAAMAATVGLYEWTRVAHP